MKAYKVVKMAGGRTVYFYKKNDIEFEIDKFKDNEKFYLAACNKSYYLNVVSDCYAKSRQTLINRLLNNL